MAPAGFEKPNPARERPQTHALDRVATAIGSSVESYFKTEQFKKPSTLAHILILSVPLNRYKTHSEMG
jgi:hypothetical protein